MQRGELGWICAERRVGKVGGGFMQREELRRGVAQRGERGGGIMQSEERGDWCIKENWESGEMSAGRTGKGDRFVQR